MKEFVETVIFRGRVKFIVAPDVNGDTAPLAATTINIANRPVIVFKNVAPVTVTNFLQGADFQSIKLVGDGQTTIQHNANIKNNTAADRLLGSNKVYNYTLISGVWIEDAD